MEALEELAVSYERQDGQMDASNQEKAVLQCEVERLQVDHFVTFHTGYHILCCHFPYSIPQFEVQERTQQFLAIQEVSEMRHRTATELVQTLVEKIADISEVFEENSHSKLPSVSINACNAVLMMRIENCPDI